MKSAFSILAAILLSFSSTTSATAQPTGPTGARSSLDRDRVAMDAARRTKYPNLEASYRVVGPSTPVYNCIAWSLGITTKWVWPGDSVADFDKLNAQYGYRRASKLDYRLQPGIHKIVLYGEVISGKVSMTHQARQMPDGFWTSKIGKMALIRHATPDSLTGPSYGRPVAVYFKYVPR